MVTAILTVTQWFIVVLIGNLAISCNCHCTLLMYIAIPIVQFYCFIVQNPPIFWNNFAPIPVINGLYDGWIPDSYSWPLSQIRTFALSLHLFSDGWHEWRTPFHTSNPPSEICDVRTKLTNKSTVAFAKSCRGNSELDRRRAVVIDTSTYHRRRHTYLIDGHFPI